MLSERSKLIVALLLIPFSCILLLLSELIFPFKNSLAFDVIKTGKEIITLRRELKELSKNLTNKFQEIEKLQAEVLSLNSRPIEEDYLVVDLLSNLLVFKKGEKIIREMVISTGKGETLSFGKRRWIFETPRGVLTVLKKIKAPIWYKPDWAFIEEGKKIPPKHSKDRLVRGMLGDYALDLGGGIFIHGTPYENLLGRSVTHGCIRVGKEDLRFLYDNVPLGIKVYIYGK